MAKATSGCLPPAPRRSRSAISISGVHITFLSEGEWCRLGTRGFLQRTDQQFHWGNAGYGTFDDYLASLASRKRKAMRKEREQALAAGLTIEWLRGREITEADWDVFFAFYTETGSRKWGRPYLNRKFFSLLGASGVGGDCLLMLAKRGNRAIAGSLHMIGGDCLFGRYWGAVEHHPFLHFELCYYQAIDYAIQHRIARVEAGAQGEHKLARGYLPTKTYSAHYIVDPAIAARDRRLSGARAQVRRCCGRGTGGICAVPQGAAARSGVTRVERDLEITARPLLERHQANGPAEDQQHQQRCGDHHVEALRATQRTAARDHHRVLRAGVFRCVVHADTLRASFRVPVSHTSLGAGLTLSPT